MASINRKKNELEADEIGFMLATFAGYKTNLLFGEDENSFLEHWVEQTMSWNDTHHYPAEQRTEIIKHRLKEMRSKTERILYGLRLAHFERYEDAKNILRYVQQYDGVETSQVLNNLAYVYIQMARGEMDPSKAYRYWYPTLLESTTGIPSARTKGMSLATKYLKMAVSLLEEALENNNENIVALINLAVAHMHLDKPLDARTAIERANEIVPGNQQIEGMRAVILYEDKVSDRWSLACLLYTSDAADE